MNCRCCGETRLESVLDLGLQPWGNDLVPLSDARPAARYPLHLYFCHGCGMVQIDHTVPKERMFVEHGYVSGTTRSLARHFEEVCAAMTARLSFAPGDYVLDIGGNDGTFLKGFARRGIGVLNVDSGRIQAHRSIEGGIPCLNRFFNADTAAEILAQHGKARAIHGSGIFFHLEELHSAFAGIRDLLADDGVIVAEFIYLPQMVTSCAFDQIYHEHLLYYTLQSFQKVLERHGLEIHDAEIMPIHGGSCIAYAGHRGCHRMSERLGQLVEAERAGGFDRIDIYRDFACRVAALRDRLVPMLRGARARGMRIQALGAPVKGSTLINYCGFTEQDIDCAVEINDLKCGFWLPGTRIPIHHQDKVPPPDLYLMLSWNFRDEILSRLADYRAAGGQVLVPIPQPELV